MRYFCNLLYLVIGLLLAFCVTVSRAETIAATSSATIPAQIYYSVNGSGAGYDQTAACQSLVTATYGARYYGVYGAGITAPRLVTCKGYDSYAGANAPLITVTTFKAGWKCAPGQTPQTYVDQDANPNNCGGYICPSGQNWTLSGTSCVRPDCVAPQTRASNGVCDIVCPAAGSSAMIGGAKAWGITGNSTACSAGVSFGNCSMTCSSGVSAGGKAACTGCTFTGSKILSADTATPVGQTATGAQMSDKDCLAQGKGYVTSSAGAVTCQPSNVVPVDKTVTATTKNVSSTGAVSSTTDSTTCSGGNCTTTRTTTDSTGTSSSTTTGPAGTTGGSSGGSDTADKAAKDSSGLCADSPDLSICKTGVPKESGKFDDRSADIVAAKSALLVEWQSVKTQVATMFGTFGGGSGSLPCPEGVHVLSGEFKICTSQYVSALAPIGAAIMFLAAVGSAFIIFRR